MHHHQQELRHAAAQAFMEALDQLDQRLNMSDGKEQTSQRQSQVNHSRASAPETSASNPSHSGITVQALEDAVADIEQFTRARGQSGD